MRTRATPVGLREPGSMALCVLVLPVRRPADAFCSSIRVCNFRWVCVLKVFVGVHRIRQGVSAARSKLGPKTVRYRRFSGAPDCTSVEELREDRFDVRTYLRRVAVVGRGEVRDQLGRGDWFGEQFPDRGPRSRQRERLGTFGCRDQDRVERRPGEGVTSSILT